MNNGSKQFAFWPEQASTLAGQVDGLYLYLIAMSIFFIVIIYSLVFFFAIHFKRKHENEVPAKIETSKALEITWTLIPFLLIAPIFIIGANVFFKQMRAPRNSMQVLVTGKQWMWKFQHPNGRREINTLHVPVNSSVKLLMGSEDVIHNVFIPAFRIKQDVLPGRYTSTWFEATKTGEYHLFCNQYCGTNHSLMIGKVIVMEKDDYQAWVSDYTGASPAEVGAELFNKYACNTCHVSGSDARGPNLVGVFGSKVGLSDGRIVEADANYVRESILNPQAKVVAGFQPIMPTFQGTLSEEQVSQLVAYVKSLGEKRTDDTGVGTSDKATGVGQPLPQGAQETTQTLQQPQHVEASATSTDTAIQNEAASEPLTAAVNADVSTTGTDAATTGTQKEAQ